MPKTFEIEKWGKTAESVATPKSCDDCVYTEATYDIDELWDTKRDAKLVYVLMRKNLLGRAWGNTWNKFKCPPPGKDCKRRWPCLFEPTYILAFGEEVVPAGKGPAQWKLRITLGRKIECVKGEEDGPYDTDPTLPDPPKDQDEDPK